MKIRLLLQMILAAGMTGNAAFAAARSGAFDVRHELKVTVPGGAKLVRIWFTMP